MAYDWEDRGRYGGAGYRYGQGRESYRGDRDRDRTDRAGDEMRSWFGDDEAERRRRMDERRGHGGGGYGGDYRGGYGGYAERGVSVGGSSAFGRASGGSDYGYGSDFGRGYREGYGRESYGMSGRGTYDRNYGGGGAQHLGRDYGGYRRGGYHGSEDRGLLERAGDEVASWFGDDDAERRRRMDERHRGRGPKGYTRSDERIREDVSDRLSDDPQIDASHMEVSVSGGEVTLSGTVQGRFEKRHAEDIAERVSGVRHVQNNLRVSSQTGSTGSPEARPSTSGTTAAATSGTTGTGTSRRRRGT